MYNVVIGTQNNEMLKTVISALIEASFYKFLVDGNGIYFNDEELEFYSVLQEIAKENGAMCTNF